MKLSSIQRRAASTLLVIAAVVMTPLAHATRLVEDTFPLLQTRTATYTNVTVTTRAAEYIYIFHSGGMTSVKVSELPVDVRQQMGYALTEAEKAQKTNFIRSAAARELTQVNRRLKPLEDGWNKQWQARTAAMRISSAVLTALLVLMFAIYVFFCYCCHLICLKSESPASLVVWVPGFQMLPLLRAAQMSSWWFIIYLMPVIIPLLRAAGSKGWWLLALAVPVLTLIVHAIWSVNIVRVRGKQMIWAILLLLPVTTFFAIIYLAFSSSEKPEASRPKFQTAAMQTA